MKTVNIEHVWKGWYQKGQKSGQYVGVGNGSFQVVSQREKQKIAWESR